MNEPNDLRALAPGEVERLAVLASISRTINASYNVDDTLSAAMDVIVEALQVGRGCIMLAAGDGAPPSIAVARGIDTDAWQLEAFTYSRSVVEQVWESGEGLLSNDAQADRRLGKIESLRKLRTRSLMCVPMRVRGRTTGLIYVDNDKRASLFSPTDLRLLEVIADLAAAAVERARYYIDLNLQKTKLSHTESGFESLGRHARGIAHDFNNITSIVKAHCSTAMLQLQRGQVQAAEEALRHIETACAQAHAVSRLLVSYAELAPQATDEADVIAVIRDMQKFLVSMLGPEHTLEVAAAGTCVVRAAATEVQQIVFNLSVNARNAMAHPGRLRLETATVVAAGEGPRVRITVSDTGVGMDEHAVAAIADGQTGGVGLKVVGEILQRRNGRLEVSSVLGQGSRFDVYLPAVSRGGYRKGSHDKVQGAGGGKSTPSTGMGRA